MNHPPVVIIDNYSLGRAVSGKRAPGRGVFRLLGRSLAETRARATGGYQDGQARLRALDGLACPLCRRLRGAAQAVEHQGHILICPDGHGWRNPDVAEAEILRGEFGGDS